MSSAAPPPEPESGPGRPPATDRVTSCKQRWHRVPGARCQNPASNFVPCSCSLITIVRSSSLKKTSKPEMHGCGPRRSITLSTATNTLSMLVLTREEYADGDCPGLWTRPGSRHRVGHRLDGVVQHEVAFRLEQAVRARETPGQPMRSRTPAMLFFSASDYRRFSQGCSRGRGRRLWAWQCSLVQLTLAFSPYAHKGSG